MKGIILAAGKGTRLYPMTKPVCKPLVPIYDKPLIYYPLATLMQAGIKDVLVIIPPGEEKAFENLLGDGSQIGIHIEYAVQYVPRGIADAFCVGKDFIGDDSVCLILGDNIFYYPEMEELLAKAKEESEKQGAVVFGYRVSDPRPFGVVEFDKHGNVLSLEEKPKEPKSNYIVPGLYFYNNDVVEIARDIKPSARGEMEITDVNIEYMNRGQLKVIPFKRGLTWLDAGTADSVLSAALAVQTIQLSGYNVGCIEEIAWKMGFINKQVVNEIGNEMGNTVYGQYLVELAEVENA